MATSRIRGITIEIGGDTTQLQTALKGVDSRLKSTQRELRDVNKLLKLDPGNVELLAQKQGLLTDAISDTKQRLETLKTALAQMGDVSGSPELTEQQRSLQREIISTEENLKSLEKQFKDMPSATSVALEKIGGKLDEVGGKIADVGEGLTKYVTLPLAAAGAASVAAFNELDEGLDTVAKKTGATGDALEEMQEQVKELATEIPTDFATAGTAIGEVNTRFGATGDALKELSAQFIKFADINDTDVNTSIDSTQKILAAFNLDASKAGSVLDRLTKVSQRTGLSVDTLQQGLITNSVAFEEMGLSMDQAAELMGDLELSGADVNTVLAGMRKALKNATKDGKSMDKALASLQKEITEGSGEMDGLTAAYELFGNAAPAVYKAVKNGTMNFEDLATAVEDAGGAVSDTYNETLDPIDKFATAMNQVKIAGAEIGAELIDVVVPAVEVVQDVVSDAVEAWHGLSPEMQETIIKAGLVAAAIGPVVTVVGKVTQAVGGFATGLSWLAAHPAVAAAAAIAGIGVAGWKLASDLGEVSVLAAANLDSVEQAAVDAVDAVTEAYADMDERRNESNAAIDAEYDHLEALVDEYDSYLDMSGNVKAGYEERANYILNELSEATGVEIEDLQTQIKYYKELGDSLDQVILKKKAEAILAANEQYYTEAIQNRSTALTAYQDAWSAAAAAEDEYTAASQAVHEQEEKMIAQYGRVELASDDMINQLIALKGEQGKARLAWDAMNQKVAEAEDTLVGYNTTISNYEGLSSAIISGDTEKISEALFKVQNSWISAEEGTKSSLEAQVKATKDNYLRMKKAVEDGAPGVTEEMKDEAYEMYRAAQRELNKLPGMMSDTMDDVKAEADESDDMYALGQQNAQGFANGIDSWKQHVKNKARSIVQAALDEVAYTQQSYSPSRITTKLGEYFGEGYEQGIESTINPVRTMAETMTNSAVGALANGTEAATTQTIDNSAVINMTINGAPGQDVNQLADIVSNRIQRAINRKERVFA